MSKKPVAIPKHPVLKPIEDYYLLRREGIGFIEQMGSRHWTDYNLHDPGITLLEALCYTLTDLGYRLSWDIKDLLAPADPATNTHQAFFTAREILTVNPWTTDDFRRLLIDLDGVRNAWVFCKDCACDLHYLAWCYNNKLELGYVIPEDKSEELSKANVTAKKVSPHGLYEVLLELEADPEVGDLNDRKVEKTVIIEHNGVYYPVTVELRFPNQSALNEEDYVTFISNNTTFQKVEATKIVRSKTDPSTIKIEDFRKNWRGVFYTTLKATLAPSGKIIFFENVAMRVFGSDSVKNSITPDDLKGKLSDHSTASIVWQYQSKLQKSIQAVKDAKASLHAHRNLDEDYCSVQKISVEDVAVCCDIEVSPNADIELVQARVWFEIEQYFNPPIQFYSMKELLDEAMPVEEIFQGPALENGFIKSGELQAAQLKSELRVSDILNRLMDIDGVESVNNLLLTKYDDEGHPVAGAADLRAPNPNPKQISALWTLAVSPLHQPRLYYHLSRFLFYKNGLPFLPRIDEAEETFIQLKGEAERPKIKNAENNLPVPKGQFRDPENYYPVQYSLPLTYGVGFEGLPSHASTMRRAQAKQLKAYLMPFEQILVNALAQVNHISDLFSLDTAVQRSYFIRLLDESLIKGASQIFNGLDPGKLYDLVETPTAFLERRNRFLDHLLARFGEQFKEYALLLTKFEGQSSALAKLSHNKIAFLKDYPVLSRDRARAFNYQVNPVDPANVAGLRPRLNKLLGMDVGSPNERFLIIEHLLLRPKFPGDALWPACSDGECNTCGDEDPYSFRLTFVMPGWTALYNTNLEIRRFSERVIRQETPSHLLPKICWIGNRGYQLGECDPILREVTMILEKISGFTPDTDCTCAREIVNRFNEKFKPVFDSKKTGYFSEAAWRKLLQKIFSDVKLFNLPCVTSGFTKPIDADIRAMMLGYYTEIAVYGYQFSRFETAWRKWLKANQPIDWTEENLHERVEAILLSNTLPTTTLKSGELCACASAILNQYGQQFYDWMKNHIDAGATLAVIKSSSLPTTSITVACLDSRFDIKVKTAIQSFLDKHYNSYREVSYRLWILLDLMSKLENIYPIATLHDCDDGSDANPVRLNQTGLGVLRMQEDEEPPLPDTPSGKQDPTPIVRLRSLQESERDVDDLPLKKPQKKLKSDKPTRVPKKPK